MPANPLKALSDYSRFVAGLLSQSNVQSSTVAVWSDSPYTSVAEGEVFFTNGYDDFPHPNDLTLASTMPHHKHIPPDIKHHRIPAPNMSFERPNLPALIQEIEEPGSS